MRHYIPLLLLILFTSATTQAQLTSGLNDIQLSNLLAYPNPISGTVSITAVDVEHKEVKITVLNSVGQPVYESKATSINGHLNTSINMQQYAAGMYLIKLSANGMACRETLE